MIRDKIDKIIHKVWLDGKNSGSLVIDCQPYDDSDAILEVFKEYIGENRIIEDEKNVLMYGIEIDNYNLAIDNLLEGLEKENL